MNYVIWKVLLLAQFVIKESLYIHCSVIIFFHCAAPLMPKGISINPNMVHPSSSILQRYYEFRSVNISTHQPHHTDYNGILLHLPTLQYTFAIPPIRIIINRDRMLMRGILKKYVQKHKMFRAFIMLLCIIFMAN